MCKEYESAKVISDPSLAVKPCLMRNNVKPPFEFLRKRLSECIRRWLIANATVGVGEIIQIIYIDLCLRRIFGCDEFEEAVVEGRIIGIPV